MSAAREGLIRFHQYMVKTYGVNYRDAWTEEDAETAEILERNAAKAVTIQLIHAKRANDDTPFLHRLRGHKVVIANRTAPERAVAWREHTKRHGSGHIGKLAPLKKTSRSWAYVPNEYKGAIAPPPKHSDDVDSSNIFTYLMGK